MKMHVRLKLTDVCRIPNPFECDIQPRSELAERLVRQTADAL